MVFEETPATSPTNPDHKLRLKTFLLNCPNTIFMSKDLARITGFNTRGSCVELRKAIKELIVYEGMVIISNNKGFKYTTNEQEVNDYVKSLEHRIIGISTRINSIIRNYHLNKKQKTIGEYQID